MHRYGVGLSLAGSALAHRSHVGIGVGINLGPPVLAPAWPAYRPYYGPYYGPYYPYYSPPSVVVVPAAPPPVYIEQNPPAETANAYWYFCPDAQAYYPYVKECPEGWQKVLPQPEK